MVRTPAGLGFGTLGNIALCLIMARKRKNLRGKGRKLTDRVWKQWAASRKPGGLIAQIESLVLDAARRAEQVCSDKHQIAILVHWLLIDELFCELYPRHGRPPKHGLIWGAMRYHDGNKRLSGRPPLISAANERKWFAKSYGARAAVFAEQEWPGAQAHDFLKSYPSNLLETLDTISDGAVAALEVVRADFPNSTNEGIKARIRRARRTFTLKLGREKSGG